MTAINDESFYNLLGEEISRGSLVNQMIAYYTLKLEVGETKVTDFNEGSEIRNLLESIAVDLYALMSEQNELTMTGFIDTAEGEYLDRHGQNPFVGLARDTGSEATGYVTFTIPEAVSSEVVIPEGTIVVCSETGEEYETNSEALISVGNVEDTVAVTCLTVGVEGNCLAGAIDTVDDEYVDITGLTVSNEDALENGTDYEEDEEYRERLLAYIRKDDFGSIGYYTELGNNVDDVHDVLLVDDANNVYTKIVLVNGYTKPTPATVLADVLEVFTDTQNIVVNHSFGVDTPTYVTVNMTVNLDVSVELDSDMLQETIETFFNGGTSSYDRTGYDGLWIGESVSKTKLYDVFFNLDGVSDVTVIDNDTTAEITDLNVNTDEVLKLGTVTFNQTVTG